MAELSKDIVGRKMDPFTFTVERGKVKEFLQAIGEKNPIYWDIAAAKAAGKVRMEGKDYVMADGDVVEFRFNV